MACGEKKKKKKKKRMNRSIIRCEHRNDDDE
jgi:hypothetical protein